MYRAETGRYEAHDTGRDQDANPGQRLVPPDDVVLWSRPVDGYLSR